MSSDQGNPDQGRNTDATNGPDANPTDTNAQGNNQNSENNHPNTFPTFITFGVGRSQSWIQSSLLVKEGQTPCYILHFWE